MDFLRRVFCSILKAGPIPQHIAFVMDGNRRYARMSGRPVWSGHNDGFQTLKKVTMLCYLTSDQQNANVLGHN